MAKASTDFYRIFLSKFLQEQKAKRDFLALLAEHPEDIVDNITTKDDLTFIEFKQQLMNPGYQKSLPFQIALITKENNKIFKIPKRQSQYSQPDKCTRYKKYHPGRHLGHS
ncbi:hypothetical protein K3495_g3118 [Podosphaera aphanis]|nr:hypothetical protein K3495_g3118 [Podosphaera aphanis]